jgi:hypothetical protein
MSLLSLPASLPAYYLEPSDYLGTTSLLRRVHVAGVRWIAHRSKTVNGGGVVKDDGAGVIRLQEANPRAHARLIKARYSYDKAYLRLWGAG